MMHWFQTVLFQNVLLKAVLVSSGPRLTIQQVSVLKRILLPLVPESDHLSVSECYGSLISNYDP